MVGEPAQLQAVVDGTPPITVAWLKDKEEVVRESENISYSFVNSIATLTFASTKPENTGKYTCQIKNEAGAQECFASLSVLGQYRFSKEHFHFNLTKSLLCLPHRFNSSLYC